MSKLALKNAVNATIGTFMVEIGLVMKILDDLDILVKKKSVTK